MDRVLDKNKRVKVVTSRQEDRRLHVKENREYFLGQGNFKYGKCVTVSKDFYVKETRESQGKGSEKMSFYFSTLNRDRLSCNSFFTILKNI